MLVVFCTFTASYWGTLCVHPSNCICSYYILHDWIRVDSSQVFLVLFRTILLIDIIHLLRNDDGSSYTQQSTRPNCRVLLLCSIQPLLWIFDSKASKFQPWAVAHSLAPNCCHALKSKALVFPSVDLEFFLWRTLFLVLQSLNLTPSHTSQLIKKTMVLDCADDSTVVDLVLLDLSSGLDTLRSHCLTVWWHNSDSASFRSDRWNFICEGLRKDLFWIRT